MKQVESAVDLFITSCGCEQVPATNSTGLSPSSFAWTIFGSPGKTWTRSGCRPDSTSVALYGGWPVVADFLEWFFQPVLPHICLAIRSGLPKCLFRPTCGDEYRGL